jgi:uncharacterized membrane protein YpjA
VEKEKIRDFVYSRKILFSAVLINLAGTAFGFYYYAEQFAATPFQLWIFVPDSPLATLAAAAAFFLYLRGRQNSLVETYAFFGNLKYGVWTIFVLIYMQNGFLQYQPLPLYVFLVVSHALMIVQAFVILDLSKISWKPLVAVIAWFLLNDFVDYTLGTHSTLPHGVGFSSPVAWVAVATTLAAGVFVYSEKVKPKI